VVAVSFTELHIQRLDREKQVKHHTEEMNKVKTLVENENKALDEKKSILTKIHDVKVNYPMKASRIADLTKDLNKYKVKLSEVHYAEDPKTKEKKFTLHLLSSKDKRLTNLVEWYTKTRSSQYNFSFEKIEYNKEKKIYSSELKVVLK